MADETRRATTDELAAKRKKTHRRLRVRWIAMMLLVIVTVAVTIGAIVFILTRGEEAPRMAFLIRESVDVLEPCEAVYLGQGTSVHAMASGFLVPLVEDNVRVANGDRVAVIIDDRNKPLLDRYHAAQDACDAFLVADSGIGDITAHPFPQSHVDSQLRNAITRLSRTSATGDLTEFKNAMTSLRLTFDQMHEDIRGRTGDGEIWDALVRERDQARSAVIDVARDIVVAPLSGHVSFGIQPSEQTLDWTEYADVLTRGQALLYEESAPVDVRYHDVTSGQRVAMIRSLSDHTVVVFLPPVAAADEVPFSRGQAVDLQFKHQGLELKGCRVERVDPRDDVCILYMTCDVIPPALAGHFALRDVTWRAGRTTGFRVAIRSLIGYDPERPRAELRRVVDGMTETMSVDVLSADALYAMIDAPVGGGLDEADLYVVNPWTIDDGELID